MKLLIEKAFCPSCNKERVIEVYMQASFIYYPNLGHKIVETTYGIIRCSVCFAHINNVSQSEQVDLDKAAVCSIRGEV